MTNDSSDTIDNSVNTQGGCGITSQSRQYVINIVYEHLQKEHIHAVHRGNCTVVWSHLPLNDCDLYAYLNAHSFKGKQSGIEVLLLFEPIVVMPGQWKEDVWKHFDCILSLYDMFVGDDPKFIKIPAPRSDWVIPAIITESLAEREIKYPLKDRREAICMINGFKTSSLPGELYSKRFDTALWFDENSDIPFDVYGNPPFSLPNYKGILAADNKMPTLGQYKYCLCFENIYHPQFSAGYISEKILDCLETRTIPIYLGASNIEEYIPKECFIDYRDFKDLVELDTFLHALTDKEYLQYVQTIDLWVSYGGLRPYSWYNLYDRLCQIITREGAPDSNLPFAASTQWAQGVTSQYAHHTWTVSKYKPYWTWEFLSKEKSPLFLTEKNIRQQNIYLASARQHESKNDYPRAIDELDLAIANGLDSAEVHYMYAKLCIGINRYEDAIEHLERVITIDPSYAQAYDDLGVIRYQSGEYKRAMEYFVDAHMLDNFNYNALRNILALSRQLDMPEAAHDIVRMMLKEHPDNVEFRTIATEYSVKEEETNIASNRLFLSNQKTRNFSLEEDFLRSIASITGTTVFVETGTFMGGTTEVASRVFEEVHTIELSETLYHEAVKIFAAREKIHLYHGDSATVLPEILSKTRGKAVLFWLDAHYSEGNTAKGKENTPIISELQAIQNAGAQNVYLLIDDIRIYGCSTSITTLEGYPTVEEIYREILKIRKDMECLIIGDIAFFYPSNLPINISPVLSAVTVSRRYDGNNFSIDEVLSAEEVIAEAQGEELRTIQQELPALSTNTEQGIGGHYRLWYGLTLLQQGNPGDAYKEFSCAKLMGINHWRIDWYTARALFALGQENSAHELLLKVLNSEPAFIKASHLLSTIEQTLDSRNDAVLRADNDHILQKLLEMGLWNRSQPLRLHLGCGEQHIPGYINIDYPQDQHNIMNVKADFYSDLLDLDFPENSIDEVRLHHVFEHFNRVTALAMLIRWHHWLKSGGILRIETPDIMGSAKTLLSEQPLKTKMGVIRHLTGDQSMPWAYHVDQWFPERFYHTLKELGFTDIQAQTSSWQRDPFLSNVAISAKKEKTIAINDQLLKADGLLWQSTVADNERSTHNVWKKQLRDTLSRNNLSVPAAPSNGLPELQDIVANLPDICSQKPLNNIHNFNQQNRDEWVRNKAPIIPKGALILDVGAGTCPYRSLFAHCNYQTQDFKKYSGYKLGGDNEYGQIDYESDINNIPVPDNTFDAVLCTEVLEHVPEPIAAVAEMARILKPGGKLLITAPLGAGLHQLPYHYYGGYTPEWYKHFLPQYGLEITEISPNGGFLKLLSQESARLTWLFPKDHSAFNGNGESMHKLFGEWIPRFLHELEEKFFINQFTVGYHVEAVKRTDVHAHQTGPVPEKKHQDNTRPISVKSNKSQIVTLVFSKDRAMQLDCTLRSFMLHCRNIETTDLRVLYTASHPIYEKQYEELKKEYPSVVFVKERAFREDLLQLVSSYRYVLFLVDDNIFVREFHMDSVIGELDQNPAAIGFSLRLGKNTTYCYMLRKQQALPGFHSTDNGVLYYDWTTAECDFGYPLEVSSSLYRTADLLPLLTPESYKNPNTLEVFLDTNKSRFAMTHSALLCFETSVTFCNPLNMVQTAWLNRAGGNSNCSPDKLAELFDKGYRVNVDRFRNITPSSCHQEEELKYLQLNNDLRKCAPYEPVVSIIILHQNGLDNIRLNIESIRRSTPETHEIIVFDNASSDGSREYLRSISDVVLIESPENVGCTPGRAKAMSIARGKYLILLDNDTIVTKGWVTRFIELAEKNPHIGMMGPCSNYVSGPQLIPSVTYKTVEEIETFAQNWSEEHRNELVPVFRLVGFCMFIRRELFEKIGVVDESLGFFGFDDDDYSLRAYLAGFNPSIARGIFIHHTGGLQGRGDQQVNQSLLNAWELYKEKWGIPREIPYGASYEITSILTKPFNNQKHFCEPYSRAIVENMMYRSQPSTKQDRIIETDQMGRKPSLTHSETIQGMTSIIIPISEFNDNIRKCLESINANVAKPYEVILAKSSSLKMPAWLKKFTATYTHCKTINTVKNANYAASCNEALRISRGEYVLILDGKAVLFKGSLEKMRECMNQKPEYGITVPMSNSAIGPQQIPGTQQIAFKDFEELVKTFVERNRYRYIVTFEIDTICMLIKKELINAIGFFKERIETPYFAANDYRMRAILEGYQTVIAGDACVYQTEGGIKRKGSGKVFHEQWHIFDPQTETGRKLAPFVAMKNARDFYRKGLFDESVRAIMEGIKSTPEDTGLYYCLADILLEEKSYQESINTILAMPEKGQDTARALEILGICSYYLDHPEDAESYADRALSLSGNSAKALNLKGLLALKQEDQTRAGAFFHQAITLDPGFADPHTHLGVMKWHAGEQEEALDLIEKGFILSPETGDFSATYSSAINSLHELSRAERVVMEACGLFPGNKKLSFLFISILLQQEKYADAMEEIEHAMLTFGIDDEILSAAVTVREHIGPFIINETDRKTNTLSVCMITKNEEKYIARCLTSLKPVADEIIVVDTGSTDRTKDIARAFGAQVFDFPWTNDFSEARNVSLEKAKGYWVLVHDADEVIASRDCDRLKDIIRQKTPQLVAYSLTARNYTKNPNLENYTVNNGEYPDEEEGPGWCPTTKVRFFRNNSKIRFQNQVHELLEPSLERIGIKARYCSIPIHHYGKLDQERSLSRAEMYFELGKTKIMSFQHTGALRELAVQAGELKKYEQALGLWDMYIKFKPDDDAAYFNMATIYLETCEFEKALETARIAKNINPQSRDALLSFATSSLCKGDVMEAVGTLENLYKQEPGFVTAISALAAAYCICARDEGIALLKELWAKQYDSRPSFYWLSKRLIKAGRSEYAITALEGLLKWDNTNQDTLALLEDCRAALKLQRNQ